MKIWHVTRLQLLIFIRGPVAIMWQAMEDSCILVLWALVEHKTKQKKLKIYFNVKHLLQRHIFAALFQNRHTNCLLLFFYCLLFSPICTLSHYTKCYMQNLLWYLYKLQNVYKKQFQCEGLLISYFRNPTR